MKSWLMLLLVCATCGFGAEKSRDAQIVAALAEAEKLAAAEKWREALKAGDRLRTVCRARHGEMHPDSALAELFLGEVRDQLGDATLAEAHFRQALAIQEKVLPRDAPERVTTLTRLGACLKARQRFDEAAGLLQRALDLQEKALGPDDAGTATALTNLARVLVAKRDHDRATPLLERSLAIQRRAAGGSAPETIAALQELAAVQESAGRLAAAELSTAERVVAAEARYGGSPEMIAALADWARSAAQQAHFADAETRYRRALALGEALLDGEDPILAEIRRQLGGTLRELARFEEALPLLSSALESRLRTLGPEHPDIAESYREVGWVLRLQKEYAAAQPCLEKALAIRERTLGPNDPLTLESLADLGDLHWLRGAHTEAARLLEQRRERIEKVAGADSEAAAAAWHALAVVYESAQRWAEAMEAAERSQRVSEQCFGASDPRTRAALLLVARLGATGGMPGRALPAYARLVAWFRQHPEADPPGRARVVRDFAVATLRAGQAEAAEPLFRESHRLHESIYGANDPATLQSLTDLWTYFDETRQPGRALESARKVVARAETSLAPEAPAFIALLERLGRLHLSLGERHEAVEIFRRALDARRRSAGEQSAAVLDALARVAAWFDEARDFAAATTFRTERLGVVERKFGPGSAAAAVACGELGWSYFRQRELASARGMFERQLTLLEKAGAGESEDALTAVARLGDVAVAARDWPAAVSARERLAAGCSRRYGAGHAETGRASLLFAEALLASGAEGRAETALQDACRIITAGDAPTTSRIAAALARGALQRGDREGARRRTEEALAGPVAGGESLAEAFGLLGEAWERAGDLRAAESTLARALAILGEATGDHDQPTLDLLRRVAGLRLQLGLPGAGELLDRALAASETLSGKNSAETAELLGWLALARGREGRPPGAREAAGRMVEMIRNAGGEQDARLPLAHALAAWTAMRTADPGDVEAGTRDLAGWMEERWAWLPVATARVRAAFAEAWSAAMPPRL